MRAYTDYQAFPTGSPAYAFARLGDVVPGDDGVAQHRSFWAGMTPSADTM